MAKKIFLSPSNQDKNTYSYGDTTEDIQCGIIARACEVALKRCGFEVKLEQYDTMQNRVKHANSWGADLYVPIHTNAFNKKVGGTRLFYYKPNTESHKAAQKIYAALKDLSPGTSDNCSQNTGLYEAKKPNAPSAYVEAEFHDVPEYAKWIVEHTTEIGEAICKGICDYFGVTYKKAQYYIRVEGFDTKGSAEAALTKIKKSGFNGVIVSPSGEDVAEQKKIIVKGSKVRVKDGARSYTNQKLASFVYKTVFTVLYEPTGDRVVIGIDDVVTAAMKESDLIIV